MTSYAGENTAKQRQADRIDARARKERGRGARLANNAVAVDLKEARTFVPKHHVGEFTTATMTALDLWLGTESDLVARSERDIPPLLGVTTLALQRFVDEGLPGEPPMPLAIRLTSHGLAEVVINVSAKGFTLIDGSAPGLPVHSISVLVAPLFAIRFKRDQFTGRTLVS